MSHDTPISGYAPVNGLQMYYEIHGTGGVPLVLIHGAFGSGSMIGDFVPLLAKTRQVIVMDQQAHGRTADIDRPLRLEQLADDVAGLVDYLGIAQADVFGYSLGGYVALQVAIRHPGLVRKLIPVSASYTRDGVYQEVWAGIEQITPEIFEGSPLLAEYRAVAPDPDGFPRLVARIKELESQDFSWPAESIAGIAAPTLLVIGDSDMTRPEHAIEMFRLLGGGVPGDFTGLPRAQLAILPGTTHVAVIERVDWLLPMLVAFLDAPMPEGA
ncbi:MAG: alpha/beta hydrolase [Thermomicrobiales bacterium]